MPKGLSLEIDVGTVNFATFIAFLLAVGIPLALGAYVFYAQLLTLQMLNEERYSSGEHHTIPIMDNGHNGDDQSEMVWNQIYASVIIVLVLAGCMLLSGVYVLGSGLASMASGKLSLGMK